MKILYTTDLHGSDLYYNLIWKKAQLNAVDIVINGGDLLPKQGGDIFDLQPKFIRDLQNHYFPRFEKAGIHYLCFLGNDDLRIFDDMFDEVCSQFKYVHNIPQRKVEIDGLEFVGFNLVADYPFRLKDRCRMDHKDAVFPRQFGPGLYTSVSNSKGFKTVDDGQWEDIEDWISHAQSLPTIEDELQTLVRPKDMKKAIYIIHMPPSDLGLDVCMSRDEPGGKSVLNFLEREQPLLSLHGHIHESPSMSGIWNVQVGKTWAVQPGQGGMHPVYCIIDTDDLQGMRRIGHKSERLHLTLDNFVNMDLKRPWTVDGKTAYYIRKSDLADSERAAFEKFLLATARNAPMPPGETQGNTAWWHDYQAFARGEDPYLGIKAMGDVTDEK